MSDAVVELGREFAQDPYPYLAEFRATGPVRRVRLPRGTEVWLVTRHDDVRAALVNPLLGKDIARTRELLAEQGSTDSPSPEITAELAYHMLNSDPPDHTRLRNLINRTFTARRVERLRERVVAIADELLDALPEHGEVDLLTEYAFPLPITVICELLGVPTEDRQQFGAWNDTVVTATDPEDARVATVHLIEYFTKLVARKRAEPGDDLVSGLVNTGTGDELDDTELLSMIFLLLIAGFETTVNLLGNAVLALLSDRPQWDALCADPTLVAGAVEEALRHDSPVTLASIRHTIEPVTLSGVEIPAGEFVLVSVASANRDDNRFPDPDQFDIRRASPHLAFGHGIHHCVGAPLARLEGQVALTALTQRLPHLRLATDRSTLTWREGAILRGLNSLPVLL
ncbi:cytochrome P450 [Actinokineospora sp. NBRC 105648]|uniref:cytochrome P450 family protein n=1 Tax=Actinokineospora sp. NBRC 105648 TaxID=3032206 RepID=UPI0024A3572A|nr:cytochrome P450 [Actinokineospora sp. NBRC 105648]GLZ42309.1 cytochrome P450 [Actinokineospora sp. NBRC 105648]